MFLTKFLGKCDCFSPIVRCSISEKDWGWKFSWQTFTKFGSVKQSCLSAGLLDVGSIWIDRFQREIKTNNPMCACGSKHVIQFHLVQTEGLKVGINDLIQWETLRNMSKGQKTVFHMLLLIFLYVEMKAWTNIFLHWKWKDKPEFF